MTMTTTYIQGCHSILISAIYQSIGVIIVENIPLEFRIFKLIFKEIKHFNTLEGR